MNNQEAKEELFTSLKIMIENIEALPQEIMSQPINHYDLAGALILIYELLRFVNEKDQ